MKGRPVTWGLLCLGLAIGGSCGAPENPSTADPQDDSITTGSPRPAPGEIDVSDLTFTDGEGTSVPLRRFLAGKNVVLVFTRGYFGSFCMYCSTQTSRLIANHDKFAKRNAEVVVVFPVRQPRDREQAREFWKTLQGEEEAEKKISVFPFLLDVELAAVRQLGIEANLAKPATYILDPDGKVHFAYIGATHADRPAIKTLLDQLDAINHETEAHSR